MRVVVPRVSRKYAALVQEFEKRLPKYCRFEAFEVKGRSDDILPKLKGTVVVLDERGKQRSSEELAAFLKKQEEVTFVVGAAEGVPAEVKTKADVLLSFSKMTFPHELARVLLAEQVYRAFTILKGEKYHKD